MSLTTELFSGILETAAKLTRQAGQTEDRLTKIEAKIEQLVARLEKLEKPKPVTL